MSANQLEGSMPPTSKGGTAKVTNGTMTPKVRKQGVSPTPSDKGNFGRGKG